MLLLRRPRQRSVRQIVRRLRLVHFLGCFSFACAVLLTGSLRAQSLVTTPSDVASHGQGPDQEWEGGVPRSSGPELKQSPGWSLGIHGQAGLAVIAQGDRGSAHALAGALARLQLGYFEIGGMIEQTDQVLESWRSYGAFVGAFLPFHRWVDVDCTVGASLRRHKSPESRFGPGGYSLTNPALTLAIGISDRSSEAEFGVRVGARLVAALDLRQQSAAWRYQLVENDSTQIASGSSEVGGFSMGAMVTAGFDIARGSRGASRTR